MSSHIVPAKLFEDEQKCGGCGRRQCHPCMAAYQRRWRAKRRAAGVDLNHQLQVWKWGLGGGQYEALLAAQNGGCAICGRRRMHERTAGVGRRNEALAVDHCHKTKRIRGLLCSNCNRAIGLLQDNPALLDKAAAYLRRELPNIVPMHVEVPNIDSSGRGLNVLGRPRYVTFQGETRTITGWAAHLGIEMKTLSKRLREGWPLERALCAL
jgi:hypothetical protein